MTSPTKSIIPPTSHVATVITYAYVDGTRGTGQPGHIEICASTQVDLARAMIAGTSYMGDLELNVFDVLELQDIVDGKRRHLPIMLISNRGYQFHLVVREEVPRSIP